jgi:hypothetical protein
MNALRVIALAAAALAVVGCTAHRAALQPTTQAAVTQQRDQRARPAARIGLAVSPPSRALPKPTATNGIGPRSRPKICDRRGVHHVPAPDVLSISEVTLDGDQVIIEAKSSIMVCGPKVANDVYFEPIPGPAKTYRLTGQATVILVDMRGLVPAHYSAAAFVKLLRTTPELSLDHGNLDPYFRSFNTATIKSSDGTKITMLVQDYKP